MALDYISLTNFRSYSKDTFELHPSLNLIVGPNGIGKTNLLEALFVLAETKSFRAKAQELIKHGNNFFRLEGKLGNSLIAYLYAPSKNPQKQFTFEEKVVSRARFRQLQKAVIFEPNSLLLVSGAPTLRRYYIDNILCKTSPSYLSNYFKYQNVLRQRNALLKTRSLTAINAQIFAWDLKLTEFATYLVTERIELVGFFNKYVQSIYNQIANSNTEVKVKYESAVSINKYPEGMLASLGENLKKDIMGASTSSGPHRDDLEFILDKRLFKNSASRGEERTLILALKLTEFNYVELKTKIKPILLLDDVMSELDYSRQRFLFSALNPHQIIITTTDIKSLGGYLPKDHHTISLTT